ncbi:RNA-splicing factor [Entomortierella beljakovae]|nr:RNA-splicing factor [Entomortierella beljakovae]
MSYNGIGLSTARGSGTNGYVVRNLGFLRTRRNDFQQNDPYDDEPKIRKPNPELVLHEQKRSIEVKCATLQDELEDEGVNEEETERQVGALREKLTVLLEKATAAAALAATKNAEREATEEKAREARAKAAQDRAAEKAAPKAKKHERLDKRDSKEKEDDIHLQPLVRAHAPALDLIQGLVHHLVHSLAPAPPFRLQEGVEEIRGRGLVQDHQKQPIDHKKAKIIMLDPDLLLGQDQGQDKDLVQCHRLALGQSRIQDHPHDRGLLEEARRV